MTAFTFGPIGIKSVAHNDLHLTAAGGLQVSESMVTINHA